jgi:cell division protein FtsN
MKHQRGGFVMGLIIGLLVGLALALGVALYVTKVPVPFINKVPQHTPEQDAAEAARNKDWDPNSPLYGKTPARPNATAPAASGVVTPEAPAMPPVAVAPPAAPSAAAPSARPNPADILAGRGTGQPPKATSPHAGADPFTYFVQVGAYTRPEDAEAQRAKLAMLGMAAKVTEREQAGRTMYRVRVGPFGSKDDADAAKSRLDASNMESSLVRVQR